jgi:hypothetical protein
LIDLDALDRDWRERLESGSWEDIHPATVLALIRVVRAALNTEPHQAMEQPVELQEALEPFRP